MPGCAANFPCPHQYFTISIIVRIIENTNPHTPLWVRGGDPPHLSAHRLKSYFKHMYYLYILKSKKDGNLYIGSTTDLRRRLSEHNDGKVSSTKSRAPFALRYYEAFHAKSDARVREASLKKDGKALGQLKRRISESLQWAKRCGGDRLRQKVFSALRKQSSDDSLIRRKQ